MMSVMCCMWVLSVRGLKRGGPSDEAAAVVSSQQLLQVASAKLASLAEGRGRTRARREGRVREKEKRRIKQRRAVPHRQRHEVAKGQRTAEGGGGVKPGLDVGAEKQALLRGRLRSRSSGGLPTKDTVPQAPQLDAAAIVQRRRESVEAKKRRDAL